jgi:hypothetical protein
MKYVVWAIFNSKTVGIIIPFPTEWKVIKLYKKSMVPDTTNQYLIWYSIDI